MPNHEVWLAETTVEGPIALMALTPTWIEHLQVHPEHTGRGLGTTLLEHAMQLQPTGLQLWVFESNVRAIAFYERHGFVTVERTDGAGNEERAPDARMVWPGDGSTALG